MIIKLFNSDIIKICQDVFHVYLYLEDFMNRNIKIIVGAMVTLYVITVIFQLAGIDLI